MSRSRSKLDKFIDLFAGIGGFRVALEERGLQCVFSSEIDKHARDAYQRNFSGKTLRGDITKIKANKIPDHDVLCAGFPCQTFSISGNRQGLEDERGMLFNQIVRIAKNKKPKVLLLENVRNILALDNGELIKQLVKMLEHIGYRVQYDLLNSSFFGIPQKRERVYFVCLHKDAQNLSYQVPKRTNTKIFLRDLLDKEKDVDEKLFVNRNDVKVKNYDPKPELKPIRVGIVNKGGQGERIYHPNGHAITLSASSGGPGAKTGLYYVNKKGGGRELRRLSLNECKVLMGFDKSHKVSDGAQGYKQLGNAVIPPMVRRVFDGITGY